MVSDGSRADTGGRGLGVLRQTSNQSYSAALRQGIAAARVEVIVTLDAGGEMPIEHTPALVAPIIVGVADMDQRRGRVIRPSERMF